ncbi:MAG: type 4a pilus biogenesis protein PilO [Candidatus Omnitrophota bacterium]|nr:MAG: type 4a pilus biogenesis protein PilO [Candidatus Omnitrophota bacterium]
MKSLLNYKELKKREKGFLILFICVIIVSGYYNLLYKPLEKNITTYELQIQKLEARIAEIETKFPQIDEQRSNLQALDEQWQKLLGEITALEKTLPAKKSAPSLIGELTRLAKGFKLISIRKKIDEGEDYSRLYVELKFNAAYQDTINYIKKIETISPFLKIEELEISEPQGKSKKGPATPVRIVLTSLLGDIPFSEQMKAKEIEEVPFKIRDIFVSKTKPVAPVRKSKLKLEGITYDPQSPTAIINGEVVKVGSQIGEFQVKEILPNMVVVVDGVEEHILYVER